MNEKRRILWRKRLLWICLGLGLAVLFWTQPSREADGSALPSVSLPHDRASGLANAQAAPTGTPFSNPTATPPSQGGHGRNVFQVFCMPCHGDVGQGLTDEFRLREYPPEDTDCWKSGCHGERPYENGFKLPKVIPALIGADTLKRFADGQALYDFIHKAMPFNAPGSLTSEQYLQLTAFLLEQNNLLPAGSQLDAARLRQIPVRSAAAPTAVPAPPVQPSTDNSPWLVIGAVSVVVLAGVGYWVMRSRSASH